MLNNLRRRVLEHRSISNSSTKGSFTRTHSVFFLSRRSLFLFPSSVLFSFLVAAGHICLQGHWSCQQVMLSFISVAKTNRGFEVAYLSNHFQTVPGIRYTLTATSIKLVFVLNKCVAFLGSRNYSSASATTTVVAVRRRTRSRTNRSAVSTCAVGSCSVSGLWGSPLRVG